MQFTPGHHHPRAIRTSRLSRATKQVVAVVVSILPCIRSLFVRAACRMSAPYQTHAASTDWPTAFLDARDSGKVNHLGFSHDARLHRHPSGLPEKSVSSQAKQSLSRFSSYEGLRFNLNPPLSSARHQDCYYYHHYSPACMKRTARPYRWDICGHRATFNQSR